MNQKSLLFTLLILAPLVLSISFSMDIYVPSLPSIIHYFHTSQQTIQWTLSIYMFGVGIGQLLVGPITDAIGRRRVVLSGLIVYLIGTIVALLAQDIFILVVGRLLQSIGTCSAIVVAFAVVRDLYSGKTSAKLYSLLNATTALAPVIAPLFGGYLQVWFHTWRASFVFLFAFAGLSFINTYLFLKETHPREKRLQVQPKKLFSRYYKILCCPIFLKNTFIATTAMVVLFVFCCLSPYLLIEQIRLSQPEYGLAFSTNAIVFIAANLLSTYITRKKNLAFSVKLGSALVLIGAALMLCLSLIFQLSLISFLGPMWVLTSGAGLMLGPATAAALENFPEMAGTASALINASQFLGAGFLGTLLMMGNATTSLPFAGLMLGLSLVGFLWVAR